MEKKDILPKIMNGTSLLIPTGILNTNTFCFDFSSYISVVICLHLSALLSKELPAEKYLWFPLNGILL